MRLRDLSKENPCHDQISKFLFQLLPKFHPSEDEIEKFKVDWLKGEAQLYDWMRMDNIDLDALERTENISNENMALIRKRKLLLYDWFIEYKVQKIFLKELFRLREITPSYSVEFAKNELQRINKKMVFSLESPETDYDIHSSSKSIEIDLMKRYAAYLESYVSNKGVIEEDESSKKAPSEIFTSLLELSKDIVLEYSTGSDILNDPMIYDFELQSVCGCTDTYQFKNLIEEKFREGLDDFIDKLHKLPIKNRSKCFPPLKRAFEALKLIVVEGEIYHFEYDEKVYTTFKYFHKAKFIGDADNVLVKEKYEYQRVKFNYETEPFAESWIEMVNKMIGAIEHAENDIQLKKSITKAKAANTTSDLSFQYIEMDTNPGKIKRMYEMMVKYGLIKKEKTKYPEFKKVFTGQKVENPIEWEGTVPELSYFISQIHNVKNKVKKVGKNHWTITCQCFIKEDGSVFTKEQLGSQHIKKGFSAIDLIVDCL